VAGLESSVCLLGGPPQPGIIGPNVYRRLAADLSANNKLVVADLSGELRDAVLAGGISVLKMSDEELAAGTPGLVPRELPAQIEQLRKAGAESVVISRAAEGVVASLRGRLVSAQSPEVAAVDERGAGDSLTAGLVASLARGTDLDSALRVGVAAGALNVTRRGLGSGNRRDIETLSRRVRIEELGSTQS
jgi:1-phosphofructokinase